MKAGFVGAGRMGRPMALRLAGAGHEVRVLGRTAEDRAALAADGLAPAGSLAEAAEGAEAVFVCVFTGAQVLEVCAGLAPYLAPGAVLVVHTTVSPGTVERAAGLVRPGGAGLVDAPVSGGPHDIAAGRLTVFAGGEPADVEKVTPLLAAYADPVLTVGPAGSGQLVKLVNNALFAANLGLVAEAVRLGTVWGVPEETLLAALPHGSAASRALAGVAGRGSAAAFAAAVGEFLGKDVAAVREAAAELGGDLGTLSAAIEGFR